MTSKVVAIGVGNIQQHGTFQNLDEALILMDKATKKAILDSSKNIINFIDEIRIPEGFWQYKDPGKWIAHNNKFKNNPTTYVSKIGILQQNLINQANHQCTSIHLVPKCSTLNFWEIISVRPFTWSPNSQF